MTPPKSQTATGAASNLMLKATVRTIDYKVPCDFDGDPHPESEATVEVLIPNGFGDAVHLNLCNSCYQKIRSLEAIPSLKGTELAAKPQLEVLKRLRAHFEIAMQADPFADGEMDQEDIFKIIDDEIKAVENEAALETSSSITPAVEELRHSERFRSEFKAFTEAMVAKFEKRAAKHPEDNILAPDVNTDHWDEEQLISHLLDEVEEYQVQHGDNTEEKIKETIDIANMAFVLYFKMRALLPSSPQTGRETK